MLQAMSVISPQASASTLVETYYLIGPRVGSGGPEPGTGPNTDPVQIRNIEGLGPVKANINTTPFGSFDGELYNGSNVGKRNIVLTLGFNPVWASDSTPQDMSVSALRNLLYAYFMPKLWIRLRFFSTHMEPVEIDGYVESFEPNMFSRDPEVQVSIICPKPNFVAQEATEVTGDVATSHISTAHTYEGTVSTGFVLSVESDSEFVGGLEVQNEIFNNMALAYEQQKISVFIEDNIEPPDESFALSTIQGQKYIQIMSGASVVQNLLSAVTDGGLIWPQLFPGDNHISVKATPDSGFTVPDKPWALTYFNQYGGL